MTKQNKIFFAFYSFLWTLIIPFLKFNKRLSEGYNTRLVKENWDTLKYKEHDFFIQAASGGEAMLSAALLSALPPKEEANPWRIACFTWTKQGHDTFKERFRELQKIRSDLYVEVLYTPFDKPELMKKAIEYVNPKACVLFETEIWLGLLRVCKDADIPFYFINARMSANTLKKLSLLKFVLRNLQPACVYALSKEYEERFQLLFGDENSEICSCVLPNMKFDNALKLLQQRANQTFEELYTDTPIVLFASVRSKEEKLLIPCIELIKQNHPEAIIMVAPRHISRAATWQTLLKKENCLLASEHNITLENFTGFPNKIIIWDNFGMLAQLYNKAHIAFVGGSLVPLGGQNFLEALAAGIVPYVGNSLENFQWALDTSPSLLELNLIKQVSSATLLAKYINQDLDYLNRSEIQKKKKSIQSTFGIWLLEHCGGKQLVVERLLQSECLD